MDVETYSTSTVDNETQFYFLDDEVTNIPPRKIVISPDVLFLSTIHLACYTYV